MRRFKWARSLALAALCCVLSCEALAAPPLAVGSATQTDSELDEILNEVWQWKLDRDPSLRLQNGIPVDHIYPVTLERALNDAAFARRIIDKLNVVALRDLTHERDLERRIVHYEMERLIEAPRYFWFGFQVTPYQASFFSNSVTPVFTRSDLRTDTEAQHYLRLVQEYSDYLDQILLRAKQQEERKIRPSAAAVPGIVKLFNESAISIPKLITVSDERLGALAPSLRETFKQELIRLIDSRLRPALKAIASHYSGRNTEPAQRNLGVSQYPGGRDYYRYLVRVNTTLNLTPEEVRDMGVQRMQELKTRMANTRRHMGFADDRALREALRTDPRFFASSPADLEATYNECLHKLEPHLAALFHATPKAPYAIRRVRPEAEAGMTFGYYGRPEVPGTTGYYYYNGTHLPEKPTLTACAMIFHELIPGHHFHVATQQEALGLHPLQRANFGFFAYNEGWGEYAASLGVEVGAYDAYSLYGRYLMQSHVYARLVADTGLNYFGWTQRQAQELLRSETLLSDEEIASDVLRYATDLPGQAIAYGVGYETFWRLRHQAERVLGTNFDVRDFHDVLLGSGSMPLGVLEEEVNAYIKRVCAQSSVPSCDFERLP